MTLDWLTRRVEDAPTSYAAGLPDRAALLTRMAWQKLKRQAVPGDELWAFVSPPGTWRKLGKQTGYALVRDGAVIDAVVTTE